MTENVSFYMTCTFELIKVSFSKGSDLSFENEGLLKSEGVFFTSTSANKDLLSW